MMSTQIKKHCRTCNKMIRWKIVPEKPELGCFVDDSSGDRHLCPLDSRSNGKTTKHEELNIIINDFKAEISSKLSDETERIDSLQRSTARNTSILTEIKAKLDSVLRNG